MLCKGYDLKPISLKNDVQRGLSFLLFHCKTNPLPGGSWVVQSLKVWLFYCVRHQEPIGISDHSREINLKRKYGDGT